MRRCTKSQAGAASDQRWKEIRTVVITTVIQVTVTVGLSTLATTVLSWAR